jgi:hypothetical protein
VILSVSRYTSDVWSLGKYPAATNPHDQRQDDKKLQQVQGPSYDIDNVYGSCSRVSSYPLKPYPCKCNHGDEYNEQD